LTGDINDRWFASGSFERRKVQNHDSTLTTRKASSFGLGYVGKDKETGETKLKASNRLELRYDEGDVDKEQYLLYSAIEGKINPDTTLFVNANLSKTKNTTTNSTDALYKELVFGTAYRPVNFDWLNLMAKYTYLKDNSPVSQSDFNDIEKEKAHTFAGEAVIDITDKWQLTEKLAYKTGEEKVTGFDFTSTQTRLWINRLGYNLYRDWQVFGEYRILDQKQAHDQKQGVLVEVARDFGENIQAGVGYNFTDFNDDLSHLDYTSQGPFIRITAKLFDRTPEEKRRRKEQVRTKKENREKRHLLKKKISGINKEAKKLYRKKLYDNATAKFKEVLVKKQHFGSSQDARPAVFSPDGKRYLAWHSPSEEKWGMIIDGQTPKNAAYENPGVIVWSADSTLWAYTGKVNDSEYVITSLKRLGPFDAAKNILFDGSSRLVFIGRAGDLDSVFCEGKKLGSWDQVLQPFGAEAIVGDVLHCIAVKGNDVMKLKINLPPPTNRTQVELAQRNPTKP
ncbi:MAG: hypothetical protein V3U54_06765, partial [Thermodesulfobacteriota bacterium]